MTAPIHELDTLRDWLRWAVTRFAEEKEQRIENVRAEIDQSTAASHVSAGEPGS